MRPIRITAVISSFLISSASLSQTIADSQAEFSAVQGDQNWTYGYCSSLGGPLTLFTGWGGYLGGHWYAPGQSWPNLWNVGGHPGNNPFTFAVRRWQAEGSGLVQVSGVLASCDAPGVACNGGSVTCRILVDGVQVFSHQVFGETSIPYQTQVSVACGSVVDFVIDPNGNINDDGTTFTAVMTGSLVACAGDLTGDGRVDGEDLAMLIGSWGLCRDDSECVADFNGDSQVGGTDLAVLLGHWTG